MEQSVPRSRVLQEAKCVEEESVSGSKVFQGSKCVEEQNVLSMSLQSVPMSKVFWVANCVSVVHILSLNHYFSKKESKLHFDVNFALMICFCQSVKKHKKKHSKAVCLMLNAILLEYRIIHS